MLECSMQLLSSNKGKLELTYSSFRFFRSWNKSGGNSGKLLSCNHLCWNLKRRWSVCKIYLVFFKQLLTALSYDHLGEGKKREKKKKTSIDKVVGKGYAAALCKKFFLDICIIWFKTKKITTYYLWRYNTT